MINPMMHQPGSGSPASHDARFDGTWVTARNFPKMIAPATMIITMHEVRMDSFRHWNSLRQVSSRLRQGDDAACPPRRWPRLRWR